MDSALGLVLAAFVAGNNRPPMGIVKQLRELGAIVRAGLTARAVGSPVRRAAQIWPKGSALEWALMWNSR